MLVFFLGFCLNYLVIKLIIYSIKMMKEWRINDEK